MMTEVKRPVVVDIVEDLETGRMTPAGVFKGEAHRFAETCRMLADNETPTGYRLVADDENAAAALDAFDDAIEQATRLRARFRSYQRNR